MTTASPTRIDGRPGRAPRRRPGPAPAPKVTDALAVLAGLGLGLAVALAFWGESLGALRAPGGWYELLGRLFAFVGTYLLLVMVVLMSRIPWLERSVGQDRLVRWHRDRGLAHRPHRPAHPSGDLGLRAGVERQPPAAVLDLHRALSGHSPGDCGFSPPCDRRHHVGRNRASAPPL